ncbi:hypothetical protein [Priestia megaterium]
MDNQTKDEIADKTIDRINFWLGNVDSKVSFVLSFAGIFLGFIFASDSITKSIEGYIKFIISNDLTLGKFIFSCIALLFFVASMVFMGISIYNLLGALKGRINPDIYSQANLETKSILFWGSIAKSTNYTAYKQKVDSLTDVNLSNDLKSQVYINSLICSKKFELYNKAINKLTWGIILFVIFKLLTYIPF